MSFDKFPRDPTISVKEFKVSVPQAQIEDLRERLVNQAPRKSTWDNTVGPHHLGVKKHWLDETIEQWKWFNWYVGLTLSGVC